MSSGLILGVMAGACSSKPPPGPPDTPLNPPLVCPTGPGRLEVHAPLSGWPGGAGSRGLLAAGDFDGNGTVDLMRTQGLLYSQTWLVMGPGRGDGTFDPPSNQTIQGSLQQLTSADLDKDGDLDLIGTDVEASALRVLANDGAGHFTQQALLGLEGGARGSVTLADVDGDGALDALSALENRNVLIVWRTAGTGTFSTRVDLPTHKRPYSVAAADLDGDGRPELIVANASGEPLEVFNVEGFSGEPTRHTEVSAGQCWPVELAVADLDRDTDLDVALSCNGLTVLLNDGRAQLTVGERHALPGGSFGIVATDLDADGAPDLVLDHSAHGPVLFKGSGNGRFLYRETLASRDSAGADPAGYGIGLAVIDANGDGLLDILTKAESRSEDNVAVFRGDGRGGFAGPKAMLFDSGVATHALGDLDGDGRTDVLGHGMAFLASPEGGFQSIPSDFDGLGSAPSGTLNVVDANEDGRSDVVVVTPTGISIWLSDGQKPVLDSSLPSSGSNQFNGMLDVDHDGIKDLLLAHKYARGQGQGRFSPPADFPTAGPRFVTRPFFADFNSDGVEDVIGTHEVPVCNGGHCTGTRRVPAAYVWDSAAKRYAAVMNLPMAPIAAADVTGDGHVDLLGQTQLLRGLGGGRFSETAEPLPPLSLLQQAQLKLRPHLYTAEVNGDGALDVLEFRGSWVDVTLGTGNGEQGPTVTFYAPGFGDSSFGDAGFEDALSLDMDGDCLPELVHPSRQGVAVLKFTTR